MDGGIGEAALADFAGIDMTGGAAGTVLGDAGLSTALGDAGATTLGDSTLGSTLGTDAGISSLGMTPAQQAYLQASTASLTPVSGVTPFATTTPSIDMNAIQNVASQGFNSGAPETLQSLPANAVTGPTPQSVLPAEGLYGQQIPATTPEQAKAMVDAMTPTVYGGQSGLTGLPGVDTVLNFVKEHPYISSGIGLGALMARDSRRFGVPGQQPYTGPLSKFTYDPSKYNPASSYLPMYRAAEGGITSLAAGGQTDLGSYSDGGRMLKGPGDGMSDSIPATIGARQPARLAEGEFVVPADVVSHLGNGSTDAGAKQLYAMMDRVRQARTGTKKQGREIKPTKYTPV